MRKNTLIFSFAFFIENNVKSEHFAARILHILFAFQFLFNQFARKQVCCVSCAMLSSSLRAFLKGCHTLTFNLCE